MFLVVCQQFVNICTLLNAIFIRMCAACDLLFSRFCFKKGKSFKALSLWTLTNACGDHCYVFITCWGSGQQQNLCMYRNRSFKVGFSIRFPHVCRCCRMSQVRKILELFRFCLFGGSSPGHGQGSSCWRPIAFGPMFFKPDDQNGFRPGSLRVSANAVLQSLGRL